MVSMAIEDWLLGNGSTLSKDRMYTIRGLRWWSEQLLTNKRSITVAVGIAVVFVLPDFPDTWKKLSPELKHVANRRMAIDAAEADVDVGGRMSYLSGAKLAFADPRVRSLQHLRP